MNIIIQAICSAIIQLIAAFEEYPTGACMLLLMLLAVAGIGWAWRRPRQYYPNLDETTRRKPCPHETQLITQN